LAVAGLLARSTLGELLPCELHQRSTNGVVDRGTSSNGLEHFLGRLPESYFQHASANLTWPLPFFQGLGINHNPPASPVRFGLAFDDRPGSRWPAPVMAAARSPEHGAELPHLLACQLASPDHDFLGRANPQQHRSPTDIGHSDLDLVANQDPFPKPSLQHQHRRPLIGIAKSVGLNSSVLGVGGNIVVYNIR
jgi:hypothetical protein